MKIKLSKVLPSYGMDHKFYTILNNEDAYLKKIAWGSLTMYANRLERVLFKKWWKDRGVYDYAKWLVKNNRAWIHEDRQGSLVVSGSHSSNYIFYQKRKQKTNKRKAG
jgi:hypothetical protein